MSKNIWDVDYLRQQHGSFYQGDWPTISEYFHHTCARYGERIGFSSYGEQETHLSYRDIEAKVALIAGYLQHLGVRKGDHVAMSGANSISWALLYLAILELGAAVVPIDIKLAAPRVKHLLTFADSKLFFSDQHYDQLVDKLPPGQLQHLCGEQGIVALAEKHGLPVKTVADVQCDDQAAMLFTSGTTGDEKCVVLSHRNLVVNSAQVTHPTLFSVYPEDCFYLFLPMHHIYPMTGVFLESLFHGSRTVFPQGMALAQILDDLARGQISILMSVPLFYNKILRGVWRKIRERGPSVHALMRFFAWASSALRPICGLRIGRLLFGSVLRKLHFDSIRVMISGGGPLAGEVVKKFNQLGLCFIEGYGLTEAAPILALNPARHFKPGSVGRILPLLELQIAAADENGVGEVIARGENIFSGYYKNPKASAEVLDADGWLHTGDIGYLDRDNYLFLTGRKKLMIVTGSGKNIFPEEVENHFQLCPQIIQLFIRSYDHPKFDCPLEALIYPDADFFKESSQAEVVQALRQVIAEVNLKLRSYERPDRFWLLSQEPPLSGTAKIRRHLVPAQPEGATLITL